MQINMKSSAESSILSNIQNSYYYDNNSCSSGSQSQRHNSYLASSNSNFDSDISSTTNSNNNNNCNNYIKNSNLVNNNAIKIMQMNMSNNSRKKEYYTIAGRNQQQSRQFSKFYYQQVGTFLTQYKIRENYKFLQMISVPPLDPAVPKPEGGVSVPACGEPLVVPSSFPQSIEAAIHKFANASSKATCISVLDQYGKPLNSLTYGMFFIL